MTEPPDTPLLSRATLTGTLDDIRSYVRATPTKTLVTMMVSPVLVALSMRIATPQTAKAAFQLVYGRRPFDAIYYWNFIFAVQIILFYVIPALIVKVVFKGSLRDYGHRLRPALKLWPLFVIFFAAMLPLTYWYSLSPAFKNFYPMYQGSYRGWGPFLTFEAELISLFIAQEFFFRGFVIDSLEPHLGHSAILFSTAMYGIGHAFKPFPEQMGAFVVGTLLGYIGARYKTFYFGVVVHYAVAFSMDAMLVVPALLRGRG